MRRAAAFGLWAYTVNEPQMRDLVTRELIKRLSDENEEAVVKLDCYEHLLIMYKRVEELMQLKDARRPGRERDCQRAPRRRLELGATTDRGRPAVTCRRCIGKSFLEAESHRGSVDGLFAQACRAVR